MAQEFAHESLVGNTMHRGRLTEFVIQVLIHAEGDDLLRSALEADYDIRRSLVEVRGMMFVPEAEFPLLFLGIDVRTP